MKNTGRLLMLLSASLAISGCKGDFAIQDITSKATEGTDPTTTGFYQFKIDGPTSVATGECQPLIISLIDENRNAKKQPINVVADLDGFGIYSFHKNANCSDSTQATVIIPALDGSVVIYMKALSAAKGVISVNSLGASSKAYYQIESHAPTLGQDQSLRFSFSGKPSISVGSCEPYIVNVVKSDGTPYKTPEDVIVNLSGFSSGSAFSSANCTGAAITSLQINANTSFGVFYYKNTSLEKVILQADTTLSTVDSNYQIVDVNPSFISIPTQLTVVTPGQSFTVGQCSAPFYVKTLDSAGNQTPVSNNTLINITATGGAGTFYSSADCASGNAITSLTIPAGMASQAYYYKATTNALGVVLIADDTGTLVAGSTSINVYGAGGSQPTKYALSGPTSVPAGVCSSAFTLKTVDASNAEVAVTSSVTANLTGKLSGSFYSDSGCTTSIGALTLNAGESAKNFFYKNLVSESTVFNASDSGVLLAGTMNVNIISAGPSKLNIAGSASINVNECRAYVVGVQDSSGNFSVVSSPTVVSLANTLGAYYSDASCATNIANVLISSGTNTQVVYYKSSVSGANTLQITSGSLTAGTLALPVSELPAVKLALGAPAVTAGGCTVVSAQVLSAQNSAVSVSSPLTVNFTQTGSGQIYSSVDCSGAPVTSSVLNSGSVLQFSYKNNVAETASLTLASAGLTSSSQSFIVQPGLLSQLAVTGANSITVGTCAAYTVKLMDANSNLTTHSFSVTASLSSSGAGAFYSDASCNTQVSSVTVNQGSSQSVVYFKNAVAQSLTLQANAIGLATPGSLAVTLNNLGAQKVVLSAVSSSTVGQCVSVQAFVMDTAGNLVNVGALTTVNLGGAGSGTFYSTANCTGGGVSTLSIPISDAQVTFSFKDNLAESLSLTADITGLTQGTANLTINPGLTTYIRVSGLASAEVGTCLPLTVKLTDSLSNMMARSFTTAASLSGQGQGFYYSDSSCVNTTSSLVIPATQTQGILYYKNLKAETVNLTASATGLTSEALNFQSQNLTPSQLTFTLASGFLVNTCQSATITTKDLHANTVNVAADLTVNLAGAGSGAYYSDSGCSSSITSTLITNGTSAKTVYFKDPVAETLNLTADSTGFASANKAVSVNALSPTLINFSGLSTIGAGSCSAFQAQVRDSSANPSPLTADKTFNLTGATVGSFYSDASCANMMASFVISAASHTKNVYYRSVDAAALNLGVSDLGVPDLTNASLAVTVTASGGAVAASKLALEGSQSVTSMTCNPYLILVKNNLDSITSVTADTTVTLSGKGSGFFFSDSNCATSTNSMLIPNGANKVYFYFRNANAENHIFTAEAASLQMATLNVSVLSSNSGGGGGTPSVSSGNSAIAINLSGPSKVLKGSCSGPYNVTSVDSNGSPTNVLANTSVSLVETTNNGVTFYDGANCSTSITSASILSGTLNTQIYLVVGSMGASSIQGSASGLFSGSKIIDVQSGANLVFENAPSNDWIFVPKAGVSATKNFTITLKNSGLAQASSINVSGSLANGFSYVGGTYPGTGGTCTANRFLDPGQSCTLTLSLTTNLMNHATSSITLNYAEGVTARTLNIPLDVQSTNTRFIQKLGEIHSGTTSHNCAILSDNSVGCWGYNLYGQLGEGHTQNRGLNPGVHSIRHIQRVPTVYNPKSLVTGANHSCAILQDSSVKCWGYNTAGQLGIGDTTNYGSAVSDFTSIWKTYKVDLGTGRSAKQVVIAGNSTCAILDNDTVKCWGYNSSGQLGRENSTTIGNTAGTLGDSLPAINLGTGLTAKQLAGGFESVCAILSNDKVKCWGRNDQGQLGYGHTNNIGDNAGEMGDALVYHDFGALLKPLQIAGGQYHYCVLLENSNDKSRQVRCWGYNNSGQLGRETTTNWGNTAGQTAAGAVSVSLGRDALPVQLGLGANHSCVLLANRQIKCWGQNTNGQLGLNDTVSRGTSSGQMGDDLPYSKATQFGSQPTAVWAGNVYTCAQLLNSNVKCWGGAGSSAELGIDSFYQNIGAVANSSYPEVQLYRKSKVKLVGLQKNSGSGTHCYVWEGDEITCNGYINSGLFGFPSTYLGDMPWTGYKPLFSDLPLKDFAMSTSGTWGCFLTSQDQLKCFGSNSYGQLGQGNTSPVSTPTAALDFGTGTSVKKFALGEDFACAILNNDSVKCWGRNGELQLTQPGIATNLGDGAGEMGDALATLNLGQAATEIALGATSACALLADSSVKCWGDNASGQMGLGNTTDQNIPVTINLGTGITAKSVVAGTNHFCVITGTDTVKCWGSGATGQLGNGGLATIGDTAGEMGDSLAALNLGAGKTALQLSANSVNTCALLNDNSVKCWGHGMGAGQNAAATLNTPPANSIGFGGAFRKATKLWSGGYYGFCGAFEDADANDGVEITRCWGQDSSYSTLAYYSVGNHIGYGTGHQGAEVAGPIAGPAEQIQKGLSFDYILPSGFTYQVPSGVTSIRASVWGAGGGGNGSGSPYSGGSGGFTYNTVNVMPSEVYAVTIGAGGFYNGGTGTSSTFVSMTGGGGTGSAGGAGVGGLTNETGLSGGNALSYPNAGSPYGGGTLGWSANNGNTWTATAYGLLSLFPGGGGTGYSAGSVFGHGAAGRVTIEPVLPALISTPSTTTSNGISPADYTAPGVFIYTVPTGVKSLRVQMWGAGGGGGGGKISGGYFLGKGGGSGGYVDHVMQVSEGQSYIVSVGAAGLGDQCNGVVGTNVALLNSATNGGETRFGFGSSVLIAGGGTLGFSYNAPNCTVGVNCGEGGIASGGVISTAGKQSAAVGTYGSAGGDAPGSGGKGGSANTTYNTSGKNGQSPGGGGGGGTGHSDGNNWCFPGGKGGDGRILVTPFTN